MHKKRVCEEDNATQSSISKRRRQNQASISSSQLSINREDWNRSGKVVRIRLVNFMCHNHLQIDFNPRVNLLIGRNGSGKSAILTALVIGLGARSNATNRSSNIKNLIKSGENQATIEIELTNTGEDAYESDKYGEKIIVKRKLMASGGSQYELKNENGDVVSKSREDLMKVLMYHNIQTDNPVFVLNQDAARSFLKDLDPLKNYTLFLKATQMELILEKLNMCMQMYNDYIAKLKITKKVISASEDEVEQIKKKYERFKSVEEIKKTIAAYKLQRLWLKVTVQQNKVENLRGEFAAKEQEKNEINERINGNRNNSALKAQLKELEKTISEKRATFDSENRILTTLRTKYKEEMNKYHIEVQKQTKIQERIKHIKEQIDTIETEFSQRTESSSLRTNQLRQKIEKKRIRLDQERTEVGAMISTLKQELELNQQNRERQMEEYQTIKAQKSSYDASIGSSQQELSRIASSKNDNTDAYGAHMSQLLTLIERNYKAGKFSAQPKGPLGRYLQVPDRKWRAVAEQQLGANYCNAFLVNNGKDRQVLDQMLKAHCPQARHMIITQKFRGKVHDVRKGIVPKTKDTYLLMNLIECNDPDVINCLIDHKGIERRLITESREVAEYLTSERCNVPRNLSLVLLMNPLMEYYPSPLYRAYSLNPRNPRYIQVNMDERKEALREDINRNQELVRNVESKLQSIRQTLGDFDEYHKRKQSLLRSHESKLAHIKFQLDEVNNFEFPNVNEDEVLRSELEKLQEILKQEQLKLREKETIAMNLKQETIDQNKEQQKQQEKVKELENEINDLMEEFNSNQIEITKISSSVRMLTEKLERLESKVADVQTELQHEEEILSEYQTEAQSIGEYVSTSKTNGELNNLIKSMEVRVGEICSSDENIDEVEALLVDKETKLKKDRQCFNNIHDILDLLKKSRQNRFRTLKNLHEHMAIRVSYTFKQILKIRKFEGELVIDQTNKKLDITVVPRDKNIQDAVSNTRSLSGGERSFSTVALLISLWSCIDHPFYFLDEYDVFTDELVRKVITKLLLNEAEKKPNRQYTFLSPQDMSFVEPSEKIKIHKLADPHESENKQ